VSSPPLMHYFQVKNYNLLISNRGNHCQSHPSFTGAVGNPMLTSITDINTDKPEIKVIQC